MRNIPAVFKTIPPALFTFFLFFTFGCQKTAIQYGQQYIDNGITNIILVDSISPTLTTIYKDSVITSQSGTQLIGNFQDPYFGKTTAWSYVQLAPPTLSDVLPNAQYDSLVLLMKSNGGFYGDTTLPITLSVNQLTTEIKLAENQAYFANITTWPVSNTPLGTRSFVIRPLNADSANIKLSDAKGLELYNMILRKSDTLKNQLIFSDYFKGLQVSSSSNNNVYGFKDSVVMRLYYHQTDITRDSKFFDFTFYNKPLQFNHITADRTGTPLAALNSNNNELVSTNAGNVGYMQSATGLYLKVSFPTIRKLLERTDFIKIIRAQLIVKPVVNSFSGYLPPPPILYGAETDGANEPGSSITSVSNGAAAVETGNLFIDDIYGVNTNYSYDVTSYLQTEIANAAINKDGLLLIPPTDKRFSTLNRVVAGDAQNAKNKLQLNVYYISVTK